MADNVDITAGTGTTVGADEISGVKYQRVKLIYGADGVNSGDVASTNPLPVVVSSGSVTISGTVTVTGSTAVIGTVTVTGSTAVVNTVTITGSTAVIGAVSSVTTITNPVTVTGSTAIIGTVTVTGSTVVVNTVTVTGSTAIIGSVNVTGSTAVVGTVTVTGSTNANILLKDGRFNNSVTTTDCTTAITVVSAVAAKNTYITSYLISAIAAGQYWLEDGAANALTPKHFLAANGGVSYTTVPGTPLVTTITNTTIAIKGSVAGSTGCLVIGYTA